MKDQLMNSLLLAMDWNDVQPGWIMLLIVEVPMLLLVLAVIFGRPRRPKVTIVFIGTLLVLFTGFLLVTWILGAMFSIFI